MKVDGATKPVAIHTQIIDYRRSYNIHAEETSEHVVSHKCSPDTETTPVKVDQKS